MTLIGHLPEVTPGAESFLLHASTGITMEIIPLAERTGKSLYLNDVSLHPLYVPDAKETRSEFCVPMKVEERIIGFLNVESP